MSINNKNTVKKIQSKLVTVLSSQMTSCILTSPIIPSTSFPGSFLYFEKGPWERGCHPFNIRSQYLKTYGVCSPVSVKLVWSFLWKLSFLVLQGCTSGQKEVNFHQPTAVVWRPFPVVSVAGDRIHSISYKLYCRFSRIERLCERFISRMNLQRYGNQALG